MGIIETRGYTPLITAVDGAIKAARVTLESRTLVGGGLSTATVTGEVGAVRAAMDAAKALISGLGATGMTQVIARPDPAVWAMLAEDGLKVDDENPQGPAPSGGPDKPSALPAMQPDSGVPAVRPTPEVPQIASAAGVPVVRDEAEVPAERVEPEVRAAKKEAKAPAAAKKPGRGPDGKAAPAKTSGSGKVRKKSAKPTKK